MSKMDFLRFLTCSDFIKEKSFFQEMSNELTLSLENFWSTAFDVLDGSGVQLKKRPHKFSNIEHNFVSALFLYSYYRADIPSERRILYATINNCLRGLVTGCDNILDDEYNSTFDTDLPVKALKFRSVIDIMVSDRIIFQVLLKHQQDDIISMDQVLLASRATLHSLMACGKQEAAEESSEIEGILSPNDVLTKVHHYKTGMLFLAPWTLPNLLEESKDSNSQLVQDALYNIAMGCQIMDDMVDLKVDLERGHQNYISSLVAQNYGTVGYAKLQKFSHQMSLPEAQKSLIGNFPEVAKQAAQRAYDYLKRGTQGLFAPEHQFLSWPTIDSFIKRMGTKHIMSYHKEK